MGGGIVGSRSIQFDTVGVSFALLVLCTVVIQLGLQWLSHHVASDELAREMLTKGSQDVLIMGVLSFVLVLANEYQVIRSDGTLHAAQFAQILLFYGVCGLVPRALLMRWRLGSTIQTLNRLSGETAEEAVTKFRATRGQQLGPALQARRCCQGRGLARSSARVDLGWQLMRIHVPLSMQARRLLPEGTPPEVFDFAVSRTFAQPNRQNAPPN
jgi:hypothetical protein